LMQAQRVCAASASVAVKPSINSAARAASARSDASPSSRGHYLFALFTIRKPSGTDVDRPRNDLGLAVDRWRKQRDKSRPPGSR
jgi:hypothetical protein